MLLFCCKKDAYMEGGPARVFTAGGLYPRAEQHEPEDAADDFGYCVIDDTGAPHFIGEHGYHYFEEHFTLLGEVSSKKSPFRVPARYLHDPENWQTQYDMLLDDGVTCRACMHCERCKTIFGGNDANTACQWHPSRFRCMERNGSKTVCLEMMGGVWRDNLLAWVEDGEIGMEVDNYHPDPEESFDPEEWDAVKCYLSGKATRENWKVLYRIGRGLARHGKVMLHQPGQEPMQIACDGQCVVTAS